MTLPEEEQTSVVPETGVGMGEKATPNVCKKLHKFGIIGISNLYVCSIYVHIHRVL